MKKVFLLALTISVSVAAFSQVKLGVQVSGNYNSATFKTDGLSNLKQKGRAGYGASVVATFPVGNKISIMPALGFTKKATQISGSDQDANGKMELESNINLNYLELPVNVVYNVALSNGSFYFGAGPTLGYGIGGMTKVNYSYSIANTPVIRESIEGKSFEKGDNGGDFKKLAVSANVLAGLRFNNGMFVNASIYHGLNNIQVDGSDFKNYGAQLSVGFNIW